ncbi:unnamed protein product [Notodromas monacha]|uniref:Uncharacterized protein n=1 Tax=Notodromas monacha TaxID=399045 RepID=A0A7R9GHC5_9CRUS|nr:unnamed protein product [Notodromas monacha]CAG0921179.1 unnamed protein product [Notodromas monacha]
MATAVANSGPSGPPGQFGGPGGYGRPSFRGGGHGFGNRGGPRFIGGAGIPGAPTPFKPFPSKLAMEYLEFDGKRLRKGTMRKTIDYNATMLNVLEARLWQRDYRDRRAIQPDALYFPQMFTPSHLLDIPTNAVATRFVRTATNKHHSPIFCMSWTPEGRRLITGTSTGEFTLWNGLTFNFETILQAHDSPVRSMVWSHNDGWMVTGDSSGFIKYWQTNMNNVKMFKAHLEPIRGISPSDQKLATCSDDGTVRIWDFSKCQEEHILRGHGADVKCVDWHPQKSLVASGSKDNQQPIKLWDPKSGKSVTTLHAHKSTVMDLKWNLNGNWLATASRDHLLKLFDIRNLREELQVFRGHKKEASRHGADVKCVDWHPQKSLVASGSKDNQQPIKLWDPKSGKSVTTLHAHKSTVMDLFTLELPLTERCRSSLVNEFNKLYALNALLDVQKAPVFFLRRSLSWHPVHEGLFASGGSDGALMFWHVGTEKELGSIDPGHESIVWTLAWHPLGHILCSGSNDHTTRFWTRNRPGDVGRSQGDRFHNILGSSGIVLHGSRSEFGSRHAQANHDQDRINQDASGGAVIPGMGIEEEPSKQVPEIKKEPEGGFSFGDDEESGAIPGFDITLDAILEDDKSRKKLPFAKPIPKQFQQQWNDVRPVPPPVLAGGPPVAGATEGIAPVAPMVEAPQIFAVGDTDLRLGMPPPPGDQMFPESNPLLLAQPGMPAVMPGLLADGVRELGPDYDLYIRPLVFRITRKLNCDGTFVRKWKVSLSVWFNVGAVVTFVCALPTLVTIFYACFVTFSWLGGSDSGGSDGDIFQSALPTERSSATDVLLLVTSLLISLVFHEFGHGVAAVLLKFPVLGVGGFVVGIMPGAFVNIANKMTTDPDAIREVFVVASAGIWHNLALSALAGLFSQVILPVAFAPVVDAERMLRVDSVSHGSAFGGAAGLIRGDYIEAVNGCPIKSLEEFSVCSSRNQPGICIPQPSSTVASLEACHCGNSNNSSAICFRREGINEMYSCLPVRNAFHEKSGFCHLFSDCGRSECWRPVLNEETERLMEIETLRKGRSHKIYFIGKPILAMRSVTFVVDIRVHYHTLFLFSCGMETEEPGGAETLDLEKGNELFCFHGPSLNAVKSTKSDEKQPLSRSPKKHSDQDNASNSDRVRRGSTKSPTPTQSPPRAEPLNLEPSLKLEDVRIASSATKKLKRKRTKSNSEDLSDGSDDRVVKEEVDGSDDKRPSHQKHKHRRKLGFGESSTVRQSPFAKPDRVAVKPQYSSMKTPRKLMDPNVECVLDIDVPPNLAGILVQDAKECSSVEEVKFESCVTIDEIFQRYLDTRPDILQCNYAKVRVIERVVGAIGDLFQLLLPVRLLYDSEKAMHRNMTLDIYPKGSDFVYVLEKCLNKRALEERRAGLVMNYVYDILDFMRSNVEFWYKGDCGLLLKQSEETKASEDVELPDISADDAAQVFCYNFNREDISHDKAGVNGVNCSKDLALISNSSAEN